MNPMRNDLQEKTTMPQWRNRLAAFLLACAAPMVALAQSATGNTIQAITSTQQAIEIAPEMRTLVGGVGIASHSAWLV